MSDSSTPRLGLPYLAASQAQKQVTLNAAMASLDGLVQTAVESRTQTAPQSSPLDGQIWLVPSQPTDTDWNALVGQLVRYEGGSWSSLPLVEGMLVYVKDEKVLALLGAGGWIELFPEKSPGLRNRLINGGFDIWQRGASIACAADQTTFSADRWQVWSAGAPSTASLQPSGLPGGPRSALSLAAGGGVTSAAVSQTLEQAMIADLAGERVTLSGWVKASRSLTLGVNLYAYGTPDQASSRANVGWFSLGIVGPAWSFVQQSFVLPAGFAAGGQVEFSLGSLAAGDTVGLAGLQLEAGGMATAREVRLPGAELWMCQRYYQLTPALYGLVGTWTSPTTAVMSVALQPAMRATPVCQPVPPGPVSVDCADVGTSSTTSFAVFASPANLVMHASSLAPARTAGGGAGCNTQIACNAEI